MGFKSASSNGREANLGTLVFGTKNKDLPVPNVRFYDAAAGKESFLNPVGSHGGVKVDGVIKKISCSAVTSYTDRENKFIDPATNEIAKRQFRIFVTFDGGADEPLSVLGFDIYDASTQKVDRNGMDLLNNLATHLEAVQKGELDAATPVQLNVYKKDDGYNASLLRLPSGFDDEGKPEFKDAKNFLKNAALPPRGEKLTKPDGTPILAAGKEVYDEAKPIAWAQEKIGLLLEHYKTLGETEGEEAADLEGAAEAAQRQRVAG